MKELTDIKDCSGRILIGDWGKNNADMERCATEVKAEPNCGNNFFFDEKKGRCACEKSGESCQRTVSDKFHEYRFTVGASGYVL